MPCGGSCFEAKAPSLTGAMEWLTAMRYEHDLQIPPHIIGVARVRTCRRRCCSRRRIVFVMRLGKWMPEDFAYRASSRRFEVQT
jgi:hypothetical protein